MKMRFLYSNRRSSEHFVLLSNKVLNSRNLVSDPRPRHWPNVVSNIYMYHFIYVTWHNHDTFFKITVSSSFQGMNTLLGEVTPKFVLLLFFKGVTRKGKHLLPRGSKCFPFRVDPFPEGTCCPQQEITKMSPWYKVMAEMPYVPVPLYHVFVVTHYENTPIQIYRKFHLQKLKVFR